MTSRNYHPDNPTNLEAAAEYFAEALRVAKSRKADDTPPWAPRMTPREAIHDLMRHATDCLQDHVAGDESRYE